MRGQSGAEPSACDVTPSRSGRRSAGGAPGTVESRGDRRPRAAAARVESGARSAAAWETSRRVEYYNKRKTYFAHDALQQCTVGDIVLLKALPVARTKHVKHELAEIVFKVGQVIDPVTGKPCAGTTYLESPVSLETAHLTKNLGELDLSSAQ
ncbi:small ribosomal subunit protein uS17m isoform X1 [Camelus dromedarius]|uniref:small ribosomal subunit protein uS17m isoform X1 n=1 Tax=Camelus dromedarius TaxID=9838 RepID=UPI003119E756